MDNETQSKPKLVTKKTKRIALIVTILITILGLAWFTNKYIIQPEAEKDVVTVALEPNNKQTHVGDIFNLTVRLNASNDKKISAVDLQIRFPGDKLEYQAYTVEDPVFLTVPPGFFSQRVIQNVSGSGNDTKLRLVLVAKKSNQELEGDLLVNLKFKAIATAEPATISLLEPLSSIVGTTGASDLRDHTFDIDSTSAQSSITVRAGKSCTIDTDCNDNASCSGDGMCICKSGYYNCDGNWNNGCESNTICPVSGLVTLSLKLKFQGIQNKPSTTDKMNVKISLIGGDLDGKKSFTNIQLTNNGNGIYEGLIELTNVNPNHNYRILVKGPKHMQKAFCILNPHGGIEYACKANEGLTLQKGTNNATFNDIPLLVGDLPLPQDGILNAKDVNAMRDCIGNPNEECIKRTDVNLDGAVNSVDFTQLRKSMELKYDDED